MTIAIVSCVAPKNDGPRAACDKYNSRLFDNMMMAAEQSDCDEIYILSAKYGLVELDQVIDDYNTKMGDADCISLDELRNQLVDRGIQDDEFYVFGSKAYYQALREAQYSDGYSSVHHVFQGNSGIGSNERGCKLIAGF